MKAPNIERNRGAQDAYRKMRDYLRKQHTKYGALSTDTVVIKSGPQMGKTRLKVNLLYTGMTDMAYEALMETFHQVKRAGNRKGGEGRK